MEPFALSAIGITLTSSAPVPTEILAVVAWLANVAPGVRAAGATATPDADPQS